MKKTLARGPLGEIPVLIYEKGEWKHSPCKSFYHEFEIHVLEGFTTGPILLHEYIHYIQHSRGCWAEYIPLGIPQIPMTKAFKETYAKDYWKIEAEAHWGMKHPERFGSYPTIS